MARSRIVTPAVTRLPLSDGDFVDVVTELNAGEYNDLLRNMVERRAFSKLLAYIVGWSFVGPDDKPLEYTMRMDADQRLALLRGLDKSTMRELTKAVDAHEQAEDAAIEAKKKTRDAAPAPSPTSPSAAI